MHRILALVLFVLMTAMSAPALADGQSLAAQLPEPPEGWTARPPTIAKMFGGVRVGRQYRPKDGRGIVGIFYQLRGFEVVQYKSFLSDRAKARRAKLQPIEFAGQKFVWRQRGKQLVYGTVVGGQVSITLQAMSVTREVAEGFIKRMKFAEIAKAATATGGGGSAGGPPKGGQAPRASGAGGSLGERLVKLMPGALPGYRIQRGPRWKTYKVGGSARTTYRKGGDSESDVVVAYLVKPAGVRSKAKMFVDARERSRLKYRLVEIGGRKFLVRSYPRPNYTQYYVYAQPSPDLLVEFGGHDRAGIEAYAKVVPYDKLARAMGGTKAGAQPPPPSDQGGRKGDRAQRGGGTPPPPPGGGQGGGQGGGEGGGAPPEGGARRPPSTTAHPPCPRSLRGLRLAVGRVLQCTCTPGLMRGTVWGSRRYTTDSSVCMAAVHAGAVRLSGGGVTLYIGRGCSRFVGSTRNGVRSRRWGRYGRTFAFRRPLPACVAGAPPPGGGDQVRGCDPSIGGKYAGLLRRIRVPSDLRRYGRCRDYGRSSSRSWGGYRNLPPGYWVYSYPNWYIWSRRTR